MNKKNYLTWAEINLKAIDHNIKEILRLAQRNRFALPTRRGKRKMAVDVLAIVKADAYGHGMEEVALRLNRCGVNHFAVSDVAEGVELRKLGIKKPILLLENSLPESILTILSYNLTPTICTLEFAKALNQYAKKKNKRIPVHINVDTGMGRLGVWYEEAFNFIKEIFLLRHLTIVGIYTHFPSADSDREFTLGQIKKLYELVVKLDRQGLVIPFVHASNSMGLAGYKTDVLNLVRPGLMLYGLYPDVTAKKSIFLKPAMSVKSRIIFIKKLAKGRSVSYGRTFVAPKDMVVATIPIGYSDGYLRGLSNKSAVLVSGVRCPVIGRVTMDQIVIDVSKVSQVKLGMEVTILGKEKNQTISADDLALLTQTINYEIVCQLGNRLPRIYS